MKREWIEQWTLDHPYKYNTCADHIEYIPVGDSRIDLRSAKEKREENKRAIDLGVNAILNAIKEQKRNYK